MICVQNMIGFHRHFVDFILSMRLINKNGFLVIFNTIKLSFKLFEKKLLINTSTHVNKRHEYKQTELIYIQIQRD